MNRDYYSTEMRLDTEKLTVMDVFRWQAVEDPESYCDFLAGKRIIRAAYDDNGDLLLMLSDDKSSSLDYLLKMSGSRRPQKMSVDSNASRSLRQYFNQLLNGANSF